MEVTDEDKEVAANIRRYFGMAKGIRKVGVSEYAFTLPRTAAADDVGVELTLFYDCASPYGPWQCHIVGSKFPMVSSTKVVNVLKKLKNIADILDDHIKLYKTQVKSFRAALAYSTSTDQSLVSTPGIEDANKPTGSKRKRAAGGCDVPGQR